MRWPDGQMALTLLGPWNLECPWPSSVYQRDTLTLFVMHSTYIGQ